MKHKLILLICMFCLTIAAIAQAPQAIPYQAVARDNSGNFIANQLISLRFSIHDFMPGGPIVYQETQSATTTALGVFIINIGQGSVVSGTFASINWGGGSKFIQVELDPAGGSSYLDMGTQQMLSVPYALYSGNSITNSNGWNLTGNTGTNPANNFIGTTDNVSLYFRVNNEKAGVIEVGGNSNTSFGYQSLNNNSGYNNSGIGWDALNNNISGNNNTANGVLSLYANTFGSNNTANGAYALSANTTGNGNTAVGNDALFYTTIGGFNTANGEDALYSNQAGSNATAFGFGAMYFANNSTSSFINGNVAIGYYALRGSTDASANTGNFNTALGYETLFLNSTGEFNTAIGVDALRGNTTGSSNTANGLNSLLRNTEGNSNSANGYFSLFQNTTGSDNTANGSFGLSFNDIGERNTANGVRALVDNTSGSDNTGLGYFADVASGALTNSTAIGARAQVACSNCLVLGSANGINNASSNVNVGIGTNSPGAALDIKSDVSSDNLRIGDNGNSSTYFKIGRNTFTGNLDFQAMQGTYGYTFMSGNFGIGTITPGYLLEVNGSAAKPGGSSWTVISDLRLKQSVLPYTDGLSSLLKIKPVKFHYNEKSGYDTNPEYVGVLAQELKEVAPYMVGSYQKNEETYFNVDNSAMIYMLINSVKEQQLQIEELKTQNDKLKLDNISFKTDIDKIKAQLGVDVMVKK